MDPTEILNKEIENLRNSGIQDLCDGSTVEYAIGSLLKYITNPYTGDVIQYAGVFLLITFSIGIMDGPFDIGYRRLFHYLAGATYVIIIVKNAYIINTSFFLTTHIIGPVLKIPNKFNMRYIPLLRLDTIYNINIDFIAQMGFIMWIQEVRNDIERIKYKNIIQEYKYIVIMPLIIILEFTTSLYISKPGFLMWVRLQLIISYGTLIFFSILLYKERKCPTPPANRI